MVHRVLLLHGDGIGPEIVGAAETVLDFLVREFGLMIETESGLLGGCAIDDGGDSLPESTLKLARDADAILLGAVGGPKWDKVKREIRPERGLLRLRSELELFSNLRPAMLFSSLQEASSLKPELVEGLDIMIIRELTGGIYFGEPRGIRTLPGGKRYGFNTLAYKEEEVERIGRLAFEIARKRNSRLCSVDKANVLEVTEMWRDIICELANNYPDVELENLYVDNAAMQLVREPKQFDVIVTTNMFGDILSDLAAMLTGSIGMLPSASLDADNKGLFEPVHGSAPDIAGKNIANPLATILSLSMSFRYSLREPEIAERLDAAVRRVLEDGIRTPDIAVSGSKVVGTREMAEAVVSAMRM